MIIWRVFSSFKDGLEHGKPQTLFVDQLAIFVHPKQNQLLSSQISAHMKMLFGPVSSHEAPERCLCFA